MRQGGALSDFGLCHGDLVFSNLRASDDSVVLFDFGAVHYAPRLRDTAQFQWVLRKSYPDAWDDLWAAFVQSYNAVRAVQTGSGKLAADVLLSRKLRWIGHVASSCPIRMGISIMGPELTASMLADVRELENTAAS